MIHDGDPRSATREDRDKHWLSAHSGEVEGQGRKIATFSKPQRQGGGKNSRPPRSFIQGWPKKDTKMTKIRENERFHGNVK